MNMTLHEALNETGIAEASQNGLVYVVKDGQADFSPSEPDGEPNDPNDYVLTIASGAMPPHVIITIDPRPASHDAMVALLEQHAPVYGIEFTLPKLAHLIADNIDGQHNEHGGQAAIEIALDCEIPPDDATYAVVRPDPDALGAIAALEMRRDGSGPEVYASTRTAYIARHDAFQFGAWPGPRDPESLVKDPESLLFAALSAICMNFKMPIEKRVEQMRAWLETGECAGLADAVAKVQRDTATSVSDAEVVAHKDNIVVLKAHTMGATSIGYCYAPVVVIANDRFRFPGVEGEHLKYTICQYQAGKYVDLPAVARALNEIEQSGGTWGGSPAIIGSPQGVSSSLSIEQVIEAVQSGLK